VAARRTRLCRDDESNKGGGRKLTFSMSLPGDPASIVPAAFAASVATGWARYLTHMLDAYAIAQIESIKRQIKLSDDFDMSRETKLQLAQLAFGSVADHLPDGDHFRVALEEFAREVVECSPESEPQIAG
jgi:hypothetical protein